MNGVINFHKPINMTSHDVVYLFRKYTGIKKIGHTGTLDPMATGVLPICIGQTTRLIEYMKDDKHYSAEMKLGYDSETQDIWGNELIYDPPVNYPPEEEVKKSIKNFEGKIIQRIPGFSAQKFKGKKFYEYARNGEDIPVKTKNVEIFHIGLENYDPINGEIKLNIHCSKGTYIRTICSDLGKLLGTTAVMSKLVRTEAGGMKLDDSVTINELEDNIRHDGNINRYLRDATEYLTLEKYEIDSEQSQRFTNGITLNVTTNNNSNYAVYCGRLIGIGVGTAGGLKPHKVFKKEDVL